MCASEPCDEGRRGREAGAEADATTVVQVSLSAFAFLFSELVQYSQQRVSNVEELEARLKQVGQEVGERALEMLAWREKGTRKETQIVGTLSFVHTVVWKALFGRAADALEKGTQADNEYMIVDREPLINRFISVPKDLGHLNCAAFNAGVVRGVLVAAGFPCQVSAHFVPQDGYKQRTVILIRFDESVLVREEMKL